MARSRQIAINVLQYFVMPVVIIGAAVLVFMVFVRFLKPVPARRETEENNAIAVRTATIDVHDEPIQIEASGLVVPYREVEVSAQVAGRIKKKEDICRAGRYVTQQTPLLEIEPDDYEVARDQAEGSLNELKSEIANTQALIQIAKKQLEVEERDYKRETGLRGVVSQADLDQAERELLASRNSLVTLQNQLSLNQSRQKRLEAALRKSKTDLTRTSIYAPVSGVIVSDSVEQDMYVQPGTPILVMEDTSKVEIKCNLKKEELQWLWLTPREPDKSKDRTDAAIDYEIPRTAADVYFDLGGVRYCWQGKLDRYDGFGLDAATRTVPIRVVVDEPRKVSRGGEDSRSLRSGPRALLRGMYVTVHLEANPTMQLWRVPHEAVRPGKVVWLVREGKLVKRNVRIAQSLDDKVLVHLTNGRFLPDDRVVISPLGYPREGMEVDEEIAADDEPSEEARDDDRSNQANEKQGDLTEDTKAPGDQERSVRSSEAAAESPKQNAADPKADAETASKEKSTASETPQ